MTTIIDNKTNNRSKSASIQKSGFSSSSSVHEVKDRIRIRIRISGSVEDFNEQVTSDSGE